MSLIMRLARAGELDWINQRYREVDFVASDSSDLIAVAEVGGQAAGLGRVTMADEGVGELGGIVVFPAFRASGVARQIIDFLIAQAGCHTLYCLPFAPLEALYAAAGFMRVENLNGVPDQVKSKHGWCKRHYPTPVLLMRRTASAELPGDAK